MTGASLKSNSRSLRTPHPPRRGRPVDEQLQERRREAILETATRAFARHGYQNTDVQQIAEALRLSKGTVYRYFPSKERLFLAAVERGVDQLEERMNHVLDTTPDPLDRISAATRAYLQFFEEHPNLVELFVQERAEFRDRRKPVYFERGCKNEDRWRSDLLQLMSEGRLRRVSPDRIMNVMGDLVYGTMFANYFSGRPRSSDQQAREIIDVVFKGILADQERNSAK